MFNERKEKEKKKKKDRESTVGFDWKDPLFE